jgi:serine/threonine-protein kinase
MISREELDFALAVLPRYGGRMGDTLISLGLVGSLDIFRAIRNQGKDRLTDLFLWHTGRLSLYLGQEAPHVEFPLDLDLLPLLVAGLEAAQPGEEPLALMRPRLDATIGPATMSRPHLRTLAWPPAIARLLEAMSEPLTLRDVLATMTEDKTTASDVLRAVQILLAAKILAWQ